MAFGKKDDAKYIAHLDLTRVFERALRRAGIPMAYSEGFNPHPKISFGSALAVGVEGEREYVDLELKKEDDEDAAAVMSALQGQFPPGITLLEGRVMRPEVKPLMAVLNLAVYQVRLPLAAPLPEESLREAILSWLSRTQVNYLCFSKKGRQEKDIRPWVEKMTGSVQDGWVALDLEITIGNQGSVRPEEVAASLGAMENLPLTLGEMRIRRTGLYICHNGRRRTPLENSDGAQAGGSAAVEEGKEREA
jgi:radical SAM-linked protein